MLAALVAGIAWMQWPPDYGLLQPDSSSYLAASPVRGHFYPNLLRLVVGEGGDPSIIVPLQLAALLGSAAWVGLEVANLGRRMWIGALFFAFVAANGEIVKYAFTVLADTWAATLSMIMLACVLRALRLRAGRWLLLATIAATSMVLLRPTGWAAVPVVPMLSLVLLRAGWPKLRTALIGLVAIGVPILTATAIEPSDRRSDIAGFAALTLFGKYALFVEKAEGPIEIEVASRVLPMRQEIEDQSNPIVSWGLRTLYAEHLRYGIWPQLADRYRLDATAGMAIVRKMAVDNPAAFLAEVTRELALFWMMPDLRTADEQAAIEDALRRATAAVELAGVSPGGMRMPMPLVWGLRAIGTVLGASSLALIVFATFNAIRGGAIDDRLAGALAAAIFVWATAGGIAIAHAPIARYVLAVWPAAACIAALLAAWLGPRGQNST